MILYYWDNKMSYKNRPYPLRIPDEMRDYLQSEADKNNRSLHAEIVMRLQRSLPDNLDIPKEKFDRPSSSRSSSSKKILDVTKGSITARPMQWDLDDLEKFKDSVDYMMKMLEIMKDDLPSDQAESEDASNVDVKSKLSTKDHPDWGTF